MAGWSRGMTRGWILYSAAFLVAAATDLISKEVVFDRLGMPGVSPAVTVVPGMLWIETNLNEGALFGMGQGLGALFSVVSVAALAMILGVVARTTAGQEPALVAALGLISGGIVGNLYDRLGLPGLSWHAPLARQGEPVMAVRDWIHFRLDGIIDWPIFNLADSWLVIGSATLVLLSLFPPRTPATDAHDRGKDS